VRGLIDLILQPTQPATLGLVLPGVKIPGSPVFVPFWYGIISIFIVAAIHEFFHGVYSRLYKVDVKSSGVAFLGPILAAFVEPEEEQLKKRSKLAQLSVFAAGAFSNMLTAAIVLLVMLFIMIPLTNSMVDVSVSQVEKDFPLYNAGLQPGEMIMEVNSKQVTNVPSFTEAIKDIKPDDKVIIKTDKNAYIELLKKFTWAPFNSYFALGGTKRQNKQFKKLFTDRDENTLSSDLLTEIRYNEFKYIPMEYIMMHGMDFTNKMIHLMNMIKTLFGSMVTVVNHYENYKRDINLDNDMKKLIIDTELYVENALMDIKNEINSGKFNKMPVVNRFVEVDEMDKEFINNEQCGC
jgi:hypothetical protein